MTCVQDAASSSALAEPSWASVVANSSRRPQPNKWKCASEEQTEGAAEEMPSLGK